VSSVTIVLFIGPLFLFTPSAKCTAFLLSEPLAD
jgi:hypothetical protein